MALSVIDGAKSFVKRITGDEDTRLAHDLDEMLKEAQDARRPYEAQWLLNMAFYMAQQWVIWSAAMKQLDRPAVDPWRVMPVINKIRPAINKSHAKLLQTRQTAKTQPAGSSPENEIAARACDTLLNYLEPVTKSEVARSKAAQTMLICGTSFLKDCWDPMAGPVLGIDPETQKPFHAGQIATHDCTPFELFFEPNAEEVWEANWCFHVTIRTKSYIKDRFGREVDEVDLDSNQTYDGQLRSILTGGEAAKSRGCVLKEFYQRPTEEFPDGRVVVYVNDEILEETVAYKRDPLPFTKLMATQRPRSMYGISYIEDMIDPQRILNKTKGNALEIQRLMSQGKWLIPIGSILETDKINNAPGQDIRYTPVQGKGPEQTKGIDIPQGFFKIIEETIQELYDASSQHEVSHGQSPFTRTATGIQYLQEQDDQTLAPIVRNFDRAFELSAEKKLGLVAEYYDEQTTLRVLGPNNKTQVVTFYKNQIPDEIFVHIEAGGQALPRSRVARQDYLMKMWTISPPLIDDPRIMLKLLEFGEIEGVFDQFNADISQAERENTSMLGGMPVQPRDFHNHLIHIKEHNKIRNSVQYEELSPEGQMILDQHTGMHQQAYAEQLMNMQANLAGNNAMRQAAIGAGGERTQQGPGKPGSGRGPLMEQGPNGGGGEAA